MASPRALVGVLALQGALVGLLLGCPKPPAASSAADAGKRLEVRVPLPAGWEGRGAADGVFFAGPHGRPVLRVDRRPQARAELPTPDALLAALRRELHDDLVVDSTVAEGEAVLLRYGLRLADAGVARAFVGARAVDEDLFLCASLPTAEPEELPLAERACRAVSLERR